MSNTLISKEDVIKKIKELFNSIDLLPEFEERNLVFISSAPGLEIIWNDEALNYFTIKELLVILMKINTEEGLTLLGY